VGLLGAIAASADSITFHPTPDNLWDLDHYQYYTWGIDWNIPTGEYVSSATLAIDNLNNWVVEDGDILYIHLLNDPPSGVHQYNDNQGGGDAFSGQGTLLTTFTDDDVAPNPAEDFSYSFTSSQIDALTNYAANGRFGLGFDPDCHYYNDGISLTIQTAAVPEPATALLMTLIGTVVLAVRRRLTRAA
jgi:hypothetical protein